MSPFSRPLIIDNDCISNFQLAHILERVLRFWPPGSLKIPQRVLSEARAWRQHGTDVCEILERLNTLSTIELITIDENSEEETSAYMELRLKQPGLGAGESESIAIAKCRNFIVASDDGVATARSQELFPMVKIVTTAGVLKMAQNDGFLSFTEIHLIWEMIKRERLKQSTGRK
jgi:predicted nucleic acid-binding protein